jgi:hypothetical protein
VVGLGEYATVFAVHDLDEAAFVVTTQRTDIIVLDLALGADPPGDRAVRELTPRLSDLALRPRSVRSL